MMHTTLETLVPVPIHFFAFILSIVCPFCCFVPYLQYNPGHTYYFFFLVGFSRSHTIALPHKHPFAQQMHDSFAISRELVSDR